jgi:hypothetical protein
LWAHRIDEPTATGAFAALVVAAAGTVLMGFTAWVLLRRPDAPPHRYVVAAGVASAVAAVFGLVVRDQAPIALGSLWTAALVLSVGLVARPDPRRSLEFALATVIWCAGLAIWWSRRVSGGTSQLIWAPSDAIAYVGIAIRLANLHFDKAPYLFGVPLTLQPFTWVTGAAQTALPGSADVVVANHINEAMLVPTALLVVPTATTALGRAAEAATGTARRSWAVVVGAAVLSALLLGYASFVPHFIDVLTGKMAARRMVGIVVGPEIWSVLFTAGMFLVVARATVTRHWNTVLVGILIALGVMVREYNLATAAIALLALATIPGGLRRAVVTGCVAVLAFIPQFVDWIVVYGSAFFPNRDRLFHPEEKWRTLARQRYGWHSSRMPPTMSTFYLRTDLGHWWSLYWWVLVLSTALAIVLVVVCRDQWRLWLVAGAVLWGTVLFNACYLNITPQWRYNVVVVPVVALLLASALVVCVDAVIRGGSAPADRAAA